MMRSVLQKKLIGLLVLSISLIFPALTYAKFSDEYLCKSDSPKRFSSDSKSLNCGSYIQSTKYTCGPAAVMNILYYYKMLGANEMNPQTEMRIAKEMGATTKGTTVYQVTEWLRDHGFSVQTGQLVSSSMLVSNIDRGLPTIISYGNHWLIAHGYHDRMQADYPHLEFADSSNGYTEISGNDIDMMWAISKLPNRCKGDVGTYIIAVPDRATRGRS